VAFAVSAGLVWGLAFVLPVLVPDSNAVTITAGRYLAFGALSGALLLIGGRSIRRTARQHWRAAVDFAICGNVGYYLLLVIGIRTVGAPATDLVIGSIPVVIAVVGNWITPTFRWVQVGTSVGIVLIGLTLINAVEIAGVNAYAATTPGAKIAGLLASLGGVVIWTRYALVNARFLANHPQIDAASWSTIVGVATGAVTVASLPVAATMNLVTRPPAGGSLIRFIAVALILGIVVSWLGTRLWNAASRQLSPAIAGILINVETVSGFAYVYLARGEWPPLFQTMGLLLVLLGVLVILRPW
jgi:drug/metabolite transporter (DMT)-like permease